MIKNKIRFDIKYILLIYIFIANSLFAIDGKMEIIKKKSNLPKILITVSKDSSNSKISKSIKNLIEKDLSISGHFIISNEVLSLKYDETKIKEKLKNKFLDLVLVFNTQIDTNDNTLVNIKLHDINSNTTVVNKVYSTSASSRYPFLAHKISIDINSYLNAPSVEWMENMIIFSRYINAKKSEIIIADYTLTYQKVIVRGGLNIFPKWTNKKQDSFYYTSYKGLIPKLIRQNLYNSKKENINSSDGMIVCSDISLKSSKIILTMAPESQPDIYIYNVKNKVKTRVTKYKGIDVGGSFVENDSKIVFVSDRLKHPNIFAKTLGQKGVERLVYHGRNNSQCTAFDDYIVYASRETDNEFGRNAFNLYLISTQSDFIRRLTSTGRNQFPKFSTDGDSILFIKNYKNKSYLGIIRLNYNKSFLFPLKSGKLQSIDW